MYLNKLKMRQTPFPTPSRKGRVQEGIAYGVLPAGGGGSRSSRLPPSKGRGEEGAGVGAVSGFGTHVEAPGR